NRCVNVGHAKIEAEELIGIARPHSMASYQPAAVGDGSVIGSDDASLAGHDVFCRIEAETARAERADAFAAVLGADRLRGVLDERQTMLFGNDLEGFHLAGVAEKVDGHDGFGSWRYRLFHLLRVDIERFR